METKTLGNKIKEGRKKKKLTQEGLGQLLGKKKATVCNWEKDRFYPKGTDLVKLCRMFNIKL